MKNLRSKLVYIFISLAALFLLVRVVSAGVISTSSSVYITAQVNNGIGSGSGDSTSTTPATGSGGGGGGGGGGATGLPTNTPMGVNFSGKGYPSSKVVVLQDGNIAFTTVADPQANFSGSITGLATGTYTFTIYTVDKDNRHSVSFSFPVYITANTSVNIGGIILSPTIDVDKTQVKQGENLQIFGYAVPNSTITITVHSAVAHSVKTTTDGTGVYLENFDTTPLEYGGHQAQSRALLADSVSADTNPVSFTVGDSDQTKTKTCGSLVGDLNCDTKVNLVDFSVLAYWYKKGTTPPVGVDLNGDGKVNLVDFSILAYHWTG